MVDKQEVLAEIRRLTDENGGQPIGQRRFSAETGIRAHEVIGRLWATWSEALADAGLPGTAARAPERRQCRHERPHQLPRMRDRSRVGVGRSRGGGS
jgi:hypothetical protein